MCGIAGIYRFGSRPYSDLESHLQVMNSLQIHRGPDGEGIWCHSKQFVGFGHLRLQIIDLQTGAQPMSNHFGCTICYNGEIYNYLELRKELAPTYPFKTNSDTEVILAAYRHWGNDCVNHLRGMFAFAIWDENNQKLFCSRDRFGIKPFFYVHIDDVFYFASEVKALLPFLPEINTNVDALQDYFIFQLSLGEKTLFENVYELPPAHSLIIENQKLTVSKYWEVYYQLDFDHTDHYFENYLKRLIEDSVYMHTRSDVPIGACISGGIDSSIVALLCSKHSNDKNGPFIGFTGKFSEGPEYDESNYARLVSKRAQMPLHEVNITSSDFIGTIEKIIYHLDFPVAGPGSFAQYHVSKLASQHRKVVLGGQGGDEIFGGYTRYLIAYFEQCIKAAIDGTANKGSFIVTYESVISNLGALRNYKPLLQEFWKEGLFESLDKRYFRLINRSPSLQDEIRWDQFAGNYSPFEKFLEIFHGKNVDKESYFDSMTHFDFKTLLPALLHVEDRMSMAHGVESRVPLVDHRIVEFAATMPSNIKFKDGALKKILIHSMRDILPTQVVERKDKMGFPVPLQKWFKNELREFVCDVFQTSRQRHRPFFNHDAILKGLGNESQFGRKIWGLLSLELWHQQFHDKMHLYRDLLKKTPELSPHKKVPVLTTTI